MSPRTKERNEEMRQRSIAAIRQTALELFARLGYHSTSISQIAREAGISKGLMYNYFKSKEELLHSIILEAVEVNRQWWMEIIRTVEDPFEQLKQMTEKAIQMVRGDLHYWKLLTSLAFQTDVLKGMEQQLGTIQAEIIELSIDLFRRLGMPEPEKEAFFYGAVMDGMFLHYMNMEDQYPLQEMKAFILQRYQKYSITPDDQK